MINLQFIKDIKQFCRKIYSYFIGLIQSRSPAVCKNEITKNDITSKMEIHSDYTSPEDILGRRLLAEEILNGLWVYSQSNNDGLVFSLTGEWGSGKSTLLTYLTDQLKEKEADYFKIIDFNPWMFSGEESIKEAFLTQFALGLSEKESKITDISKKVYALAKAFRWLKYVHSVTGKVQEGVEDFLSTLSEKNDISKIKKEIDAILSKKKGKVVIIIDDLDRLMPEQIFEVFQIVSLVANFKNVIYILSFDRQIVVDCIEKKYPKKGLDYLEKIIQVDYELPAILDEKLEDLFKEKINELNKIHKFHFNDDRLRQLWSYHGLKAYFKTIRDFKRFFNSFQFRLGAIKDEVNTVDFLAVEVLRIFDFESYTKFYSFFKENITSVHEPDLGLTDEQFLQISKNANKVIKSLAKYEQTKTYRRYDWNEKRLLDKHYFDRYFSLMVNKKDITENDIISLIERPSERERILINAYKKGKVPNFLSRLSSSSLHISYSEYEYEFIEAIIKIFNKHPELFSQFLDEIIDVIINLLCGPTDRDYNVALFFDSFSHISCQNSIIHMYFFHYMKINVEKNDSFREDYRRIFDDYYKKKIERISQNYLPIFKSSETFYLDHTASMKFPFVKFLYQINYLELFPTDYEVFLKKAISDHLYVIFIAKELTGMRFEGSKQKRNLTLIKKIFPFDTLTIYLKNVKEISNASLSTWDKKVKETILEIEDNLE